MSLEIIAPHKGHTRFVDGLLELIRIMGMMMPVNPDAGYAEMAAENYQHGNRTQADDLLEEIILRLPYIGGGGGGGIATWGAILGTLANQTDLMAALNAKENKAEKNAANGYPGLDGFNIRTKNTLGTVTSVIKNDATASRVYTFPDKDITVASKSDVMSNFFMGFGTVNVADNTNYYFGQLIEATPSGSPHNRLVFNFPFDGTIFMIRHSSSYTLAPSNEICNIVLENRTTLVSTVLGSRALDSSNGVREFMQIPVLQTHNYIMRIDVPTLANNGNGIRLFVQIFFRRND